MTDEELTQYLVMANATHLAYMEKERPMFHWTVPYVAGHKYYIRWGYGMDFDSVNVEIIPWLWNDEDSVHFTMPHYETRAAIYFTPDMGRKNNMTLANTDEPDQTMGMNNVYNQTEIREAEFVVNARDGSGSMNIAGHRCIVNCAPYIPPVNDVPIEKETHLWSDPRTWKNLDNRVPLPDEDVIVESGWNIIYDIGRSPLYKSVTINGKVTFLQG